MEGHTSQGNAHSPKKERAKARPWSATRAEETIWRGTATQAGKREKAEDSKTTKGAATSAESTDAMEQAAGPTKGKEKAKAQQKESRPGVANKQKTRKGGKDKKKTGKMGATKSVERSRTCAK